MSQSVFVMFQITPKSVASVAPLITLNVNCKHDQDCFHQHVKYNTYLKQYLIAIIYWPNR
jgi:hypothetical protein